MASIADGIQALHAKDYAIARAIFSGLAESDAQARYLLGTMVSFGQGGPSDPAEAAKHYHRAADMGSHEAQYNLGALYAQGRGVAKDFAESLRWYTLAAEGGNADAMLQVGVMHATAEGVPPNLAEAARWWKAAAELGNPESMRLLGRLHANGQGGCPRDAGLAAYWFFKAWQGGLDDAEQDIIRVRADLEAAAEAGSAEAQNALGLLLRFGHDDPVAAMEWFERAAAQDHPEALRMLGYLQTEGGGIEVNEGRAADLYRRAAELGDHFAQFNLAVMIDQAQGGLGRDLGAAIKWFRRAADQGVGQANQPLAELLAERNRDRRDANEAIQRIVAAAGSGPPDAEYQLQAGDGSWTVRVKKQGAVVALDGLTLDELSGVSLPDEE